MSQHPLNIFAQAQKAIHEAQSILIISHRNPDADAVGANLALREALLNIGKKVDSACIDPVPQNCLFLKGSETYKSQINPSDYELIISVDCGSHKLIGFHEKQPEILDLQKREFINIDHHPSNDHFGSINLVLDQAPATCFILFLFFTSLGWTITSNMATALLHGLYYDTGSFMHSNTSADVLRMAGRLLALGADHKSCIKTQFHTTSLPKLKLWGQALSRAEFNEKQAVISAIQQKDFKQTESEYEDISGLINILSHAADAKFCMLLTENEKGQIKGSLRTQRDDVNVSAIAGLFGGGGHTKAAGFTIEGKLRPKTTWEIQ